MSLKNIIILCLSIALAFGQQGQAVTCLTSDCFIDCGSPSNSEWINVVGGCAIQDCSAVGSLSFVLDPFCQSCPQGGKSNIYANAQQTGCQASPVGGTLKQACQSSSNCSACPKIPVGFNWSPNSDGTTCSVQSCNAQQYPVSGLTDAFCASCVQSKGQVWANFDGSLCVIASASCSRKTGWTDFDCKVCNNGITGHTTLLYATADRTACSATPSPGKNVQCQDSYSTCYKCGTVNGFDWNANADQKNCNVINCNAAPLPKAGVTDQFCASCPGDGKGNTQIWANAEGSACVASTQSCSSQSGWTDSNCAACYGTAQGANQYATLDKAGCSNQQNQQSINGSDNENGNNPVLNSSLLVFSIFTLFLSLI
ncbi:hypothetical protein ABPG74_010341 [Tetrahymena malaccensis]